MMVQESIITLSISQAADSTGSIFHYYVMQDGNLLTNNQNLSVKESTEVREISRSHGAMFEPGYKQRISTEEQISTGKRLFDLWLASSWDKVKVPSGARRILVIASEVPDILNLPWELLVLPDGKHIGVNPNFSMRRLPKSKVPLPEFDGGLRPKPLRLLFMACSPINEAVLDYELEEESLLNAIGNLDVACDFGELGSFEELQERLSDFQPHIVHLTGHGAIGKKCTNCGRFNVPEEDECHYCYVSLMDIKPQGYFLFEDESGLGDPRSSEELGQILAGSGVQCAFISGCQTGKAPDVEALGGICQGLALQEVPLAIGWAASIADGLATKFAAIFYRNLASNQTIDRALYMARNGIWNDCKARGDPSWLLPVLYSATTQSQILDSKLPRDEPPRESKHLLKPLPGIEGYAPHFVGRRREQQHILPRLRSGDLQVVILTGLGGNGKSSLATKIARKLEAEGFILIPISSSDNNPLNAMRIFEACTIAFREAALKCKGSGDNAKAVMMGAAAQDLKDPLIPSKDRLHEVVSVLNSGKFLLILDNFESNMDKESLKILTSEISDFYQHLLNNLSGNSRAIITSRYLPSGLADLPRTAEEESLGDFGQAAFIKILRRDQKVEERLNKGDLDLDLFRELHSTFGGTPRFLNQIMDLLRNMNAQDLRQDLAKVKLPSDDDNSELRRVQEEYFNAIFTPTLYGYLGPESQKALSKAAVYDIAVNLDGLAVVTGEIQDNLSRFVRDWQYRAFAYPDREKKLWAIYGLLRGWLLDQLSIEDRKIAHKAAGDFLGDLVTRNSESDLRLSEVECLQEARAQYLQAEDYDMAIKVTNPISALFIRLGLYDLTRSLNLEILSYQNHPDPMDWIGRSYIRQGAYTEAHDWFSKELSIAGGCPRNASSAYYHLGVIDVEQGNYDDAKEKFKKALEIEQQNGISSHENAIRAQLVMIDIGHGKYGARDELIDLLQISQKIGDKSSEAICLNNLATIDMKQGKHDDAEEETKKALEILKQFKNPYVESHALHNLASIYMEQKRYDDASELFQKALIIRQQSGDMPGVASSLHQMGLLAYIQGKQSQGIRLVALSYLIASSIRKSTAATCWRTLCGMASELGYSQEQFDAMRKEIEESYQKDGGMALLKAAFKDRLIARLTIASPEPL